MGLLYWLFKIAQVTGGSACLFIALWLLFKPYYEPVTWIRVFEIAGSLIAFVLLALDVLDIAPEVD